MNIKHKIVFLFLLISQFVGVKAQSTEAEYVRKGDNYFYGNGVSIDYSKCIEWYEKAAELGNIYSMSQLGFLYYNGKGTNVDYNKAFSWWQKASERGNPYSMGSLAFMYSHGQGTLVDYQKSYEWYSRGAENGDAFSMQGLGLLFFNGMGINKDYQKSFYWFQQGAKKENTNSMEWLGFSYENGYGTSKDIEEAKKWYTKAANKGGDFAKNRLKEIGGLPSSGVPILTWESSINDTETKTYNLKIGVKSSSKIEEITLFNNGQIFESNRGINAVQNDGYEFVIKKTLNLLDGTNNIKAIVKNSVGSTTIERNITLITHKTPSTSERRIALVIGNANYKGNDKLENPVNDATDIATKLEMLGFHTIKALDQNQQGMEAAMTKFGHEAVNYDVALFYYAGHGVRVDGVNYLVPIDANLPDETSVKYNCTNANQVLDYMEKAHCKMKIVILDACRNNPFERSWHRGLEQGGLSTMNAPVGTLIAFSTAPGNVAADGKNGQRNSPYTSAILQMLDKPNVSLTDFFQDVLNIVYDNTNGQQTPWTSNSFRGKFYFNKK